MGFNCNLYRMRYLLIRFINFINQLEKNFFHSFSLLPYLLQLAVVVVVVVVHCPLPAADAVAVAIAVITKTRKIIKR